MAKYMTKQRKVLIDFFAHHADETLSARQIAALLEGESISVSAVYRNLSEMEQEGMVRRATKAGSREVFFQYMEAPECKQCLHLSCKRCGRTYHMDTQEAEELIRSITRSEQFTVDKADTVLYGVCGMCQKEK